MDIRLIASMIETLRQELAAIDRVIAGFEELAIANGNGSSKGRKASPSHAHLPVSTVSSRTEFASEAQPARKAANRNPKPPPKEFDSISVGGFHARPDQRRFS
jgi:hypothetical protein